MHWRGDLKEPTRRYPVSGTIQVPGWEAGMGAPSPPHKSLERAMVGRVCFPAQWPLSPPHTWDHPTKTSVREHLTLPDWQLCLGFVFSPSFNFSLLLREKPMEPLLLTKCRHIIKLVFTFCLALDILEKDHGDGILLWWRRPGEGLEAPWGANGTVKKKMGDGFFWGKNTEVTKSGQLFCFQTLNQAKSRAEAQGWVFTSCLLSVIALVVGSLMGTD